MQSLKRVLGLAIVGMALSAMASDPFPINPARAIIGGTGIPNTFTNLVTTNSVAASSTNSLANQPILIVPGYDLGLDVDITGGGVAGKASATTSTATFNLNVNSDGTGTNWQTIYPMALAITLSGTTPHVAQFTNFPANMFSSGSFVKVDTIALTDTNALTIGHVRLTRAKQPVRPPGLQ